ncbi:MAG: 2-oxo acid dehydrogenase subunit E2, partial [Bdellovibrionota bacterium]
MSAGSISIEVPNLGESIDEAVIVQWLTKEGDPVKKGDVILELESDKANVEIHSPESGILHVKAEVGRTVKIGQQVGEIGPVSESSNVKPKLDTNIISDNKLATPEPKAEIQAKKQFLNDSQWSEEISPFVKTMAKRLLKAQQESVAATTYNDVDMSKIISLREKLKTEFHEKYGVKLGFMPFFCDAVVMTLKEFPILNAQMNEHEIIFNKKVHLGIAISREKGLVVPVINNSDEMSYSEFEKVIAQQADKASKGNLDLAELSGGTFTITNGGM